MTNVMDMQDKAVLVTFKNYAGEIEFQFEGTVFDVNVENEVLWVERIENGELIDTYDVRLKDPKHSVMVVETIEEVEVKRYSSKETEMKEAKKVLQKAFKWVEEDIKVYVRVYDCFENDSKLGERFDDQQTYDVEIQWAIGDVGYTDCVVIDSFYSTVEGDEVQEKQAVTRAKSVLRTVKGWFSNYDQITVVDGVEVYHA